MKEYCKLYSLILLILIISASVGNLAIGSVPVLHDDGKVPQVVLKYLQDDEVVKVERELKIKGNTSFIVYEIRKTNGTPTGHYLIYDVKKDAVVGGVDYHYPPEDVREIVSLYFLNKTINVDEMRQLIKYYEDNFNDGLQLLKIFSETIGPNWWNDLFVKKVTKHLIVYGILIVAAALTPFAQMTIPALIAHMALTLIPEAIDFIDIMRTLNGDDENFLPYHLTLAYFGLGRINDTDYLEKYMEILKFDDLKTYIKDGITIYEGYDATLNIIPFVYAVLRMYYEHPDTKDLVVGVLKVVGLDENALADNGVATETVKKILDLGRINKDEFFKALKGSIKEFVKKGKFVIRNEILKLGLKGVAYVAGLLFEHYVVKPTMDVKTLIANGLLYSDLMVKIPTYIRFTYHGLISNEYPLTESNLVRLWKGEFLYHYSLADFWNKTSNADEKIIKSLFNYDKNDSLKDWLSIKGINTSSPSSIRQTTKEKYEEMLNKSILYCARIIKLCNDVGGEYEKYKEIMAFRRKIAGGLIKKDVDIVLCLDVSGSMNTRLGTSTRINESKKAAEMFLNLIAHKGVKVGLVIFNTTSEILSELTGNFTSLKSLIRELRASGMTAMGEGIFSSIEVLSKGTSRSKNIILLTDGVSNTGRDPMTAVEEAKNRGIKIFTIGMGDVASGEFDPALLKKIAEVTGGVYYEYDLSQGVKEDVLWEIYMKIISSISEEIVVNQFSSTIAQGGENYHYVTVPPGSSSFTVFLSYPGSRLLLELIDPESRIISADDWNVVYINDTGVEIWTVFNPPSGEWKLKVKGIEVSGSLPYVLTVQVPRLRIDPKSLDIVFLSDRETAKINLSEISGERDIKGLRLKVLPPLDELTPQKEVVLNIKRGETKTIDIEFFKPKTAGVYSGTILIEYEGLVYRVPVVLRYQELCIVPIGLKSTYKAGTQINFSVYVFSSDGKVISHAIVFLETSEGKVQAEEDSLISGLYHLNITCPKVKGNYEVNLIANKTGYVPQKLTLIIKLILLVGDLNNDGLVDYKDLAILISRYGLAKGHVNYLEDADLNSDGNIDYRDLVLLIAHYGEKS